MFSSVTQKSNNDISDAGIKPAPFFQPVVQRQVAGDRQLSSPRFAGDALLQNVFNGRDLVSQTKNSRATASVKAIQEALIAAGFPLPQFGADGIFGTETANAARSFQQASGLELAQQDGIVGPVTLSRLDSRFPTTNAAGSPDVCTTPKKVPIDVFIMDGASRNTALDFTTMNQVYGPCCLQFVQNSFTSFNAAETATILGTDSLLDVTDCDSGMSADETQLLAAVTGRGPTGRAKLVFVNTLNPTSRGHSYSPLCASGTKPGLANTALVEVAAGARTPSHELGHVLLNVIRDHAVVESNIMHVTPGSTGSDAAKVQCDIIFART
jgi:Putative peptidoglycan binding domain